jgi:hypothetical protein
MKTYKHLFEKIISFENLLLAVFQNLPEIAFGECSKIQTSFETLGGFSARKYGTADRELDRTRWPGWQSLPLEVIGLS